MIVIILFYLIVLYKTSIIDSTTIHDNCSVMIIKTIRQQ